MIGYVSDGVAKALRSWDALREANIIPVRATDGNSAIVNTPLPAVAIHVIGEEGADGSVFLGGGIRQYFELSLYVLLPLANFTFTPDGGAQTEMLDISDEVLRCIETTEALDDLKQRHDLNMQYDRMETDTTYGTQGATSVTVDVHKIIYKASVHFDPKRPPAPIADYVTVKDIEIKTKRYEKN